MAAPVKKTQQELEIETAELRKQLYESEQQVKFLTKQRMDGVIEEAVKKEQLREPRVLRDPFDVQNPHKILAHPPGLRLRWANPRYREHRGWRGWEPVHYDDEVGKNLSKYINDPPRRMEHNVDNLVRRGDSILCRIDEQMWEARQQRRTQRAAHRANAFAEDLQVDKNPVVEKKAQDQSLLRSAE